MKTTLIVMGTLCFAVNVAFSSMAQKESADFDYRYDMDYLPWDTNNYDLNSDGNRDWIQSSASHFALSEGLLVNTSATSGGLMSNDSNYLGIWPVESISAETGYTTEFRVKILTSTGASGAFKTQISPYGSTLSDILSIGADHVTWWINGEDDIVLDTGDNTDGFHTFRIARHMDAPAKASVWKADVLIGAGLTVSYSLTPTRYYIGDIDSSVNGTWEMDYLRFTGGAFAPVPEPMTLAMRCLGVLALLRKRR
jgi:hypothetical protein